VKIVIDTCVLKLATFTSANNPAAMIVQLAVGNLLEWWGSPAILDEYSSVLADEPEFLTEVFEAIHLCYPLTEISVIRHEPDNRFLECALAVDADFIVTVNTARGHFDQPAYDATRIMTPGAFVNLPELQRAASGLTEE